MPGYQIQIRGLLNGTTPFVMPNPIPAPQQGGVIKIDAGVGIAAGAFNLSDFVDSDSPLWVRLIHCEFAAATRAARFQFDVSGSNTPSRIIPDQAVASAVAPLMAPYQLFPGTIAPQGTVLTVLTDNTNATFTGAPVAGPHFLYLDIEPIRNDEQMGLIQDLAAFAQAKGLAQGEVYSHAQPVAATAIDIMGTVQPAIADRGATFARQMLLEATVANGDVAAAGESMDIVIQQVEAGTGSVRALATVTIDATIPANSITPIPINQGTNTALREGDIIQVSRNYTAGMAPTPMTNTVVRVRTVPQAF